MDTVKLEEISRTFNETAAVTLTLRISRNKKKKKKENEAVDEMTKKEV